VSLKQYLGQIGLAGLIFISLACGSGRGLLQRQDDSSASPQPASPAALTQPAVSSADQQLEGLEESLDQLEDAIDEAGTPEVIK
jgi:hypothetical protein